jgi:hypothetical protein
VERCAGSRDAQRHKWRTVSEQLTSSFNHAENNVVNGWRPTPERNEADAYNAESVELFDFEACLRVRAFQFTPGSALYRE